MKLGIAAAETPGWAKIDWVCEAARRLGHDVRRARTATELTPLLHESDLVIMGHKSLAGRWPNICNAMSGRRCPVVYVWFDLVATDPGVPLEEQPLFKAFQRQFQACDLVLVKERSLLPEYHAAGVNAAWCDQGCPSNMPAVEPVEPEWDLLVWGQSGTYRQRVNAVQSAIKAGYKVAWAGTGPFPTGVIGLPWTAPFDLPKLASKARCVLSCGTRNDLDSYWSDGLWLALGMGACVIRKSTPGLPDGPFICYHDDADLVSSLKYARSRPEETLEMGRKARTWALSNHTIEHRVTDILRLAASTAKTPAFSA